MNTYARIIVLCAIVPMVMLITTGALTAEAFSVNTSIISVSESGNKMMVIQSSRQPNHKKNQTAISMKRNHPLSIAVEENEQGPGVSNNRRDFLTNAIVATAVGIASSSTFGPTPANAAASSITPKEAREQFEAVIATTDKLLAEWDTVIQGGGDAIRTQLGTNGPGTPFYKIDKAIKVLQNNCEDPITFGEASEEFEIRRASADAMAYSAIFTGGSGKPTPPEVYYKKSKVEVDALKRVEAEMLSAL
mmetsp:Transcript_4165/g.5824  ORF Transcript_4165/g.5824 Transcript_4165/m.5824 type:complete len:248 (+) Transcript_4165:89-832(+)